MITSHETTAIKFGIFLFLPPTPGLSSVIPLLQTCNLACEHYMCEFTVEMICYA